MRVKCKHEKNSKRAILLDLCPKSMGDSVLRNMKIRDFHVTQALMKGMLINMIIQICVGSSCHLKDSQKIIELFQNRIAESKLDDIVTLAGSFCSGKCNHVGVTVTIDDEVYTGITKDNFKALFEDKVLKPISSERN